ncbi:LutB/LldF family L-lactate oxidation iron-sulfur protein [Bifidobacterium sp. ESL0769]|uniref:LutB/LldF family L-lactate oxidation iron-sulfur protein n=1 Tax=Bifidobacterium sp. ESL0769 TaxID=2983229 RepID=UPI0023F8F7CD|nr:LutB/LldF family L-lactate oxidation iron-sulfur protein [Bifidobacterium sp. ESL0769]WEV67585.1 LutB/LldF family L-lactate oxidation iron-sulfur protein [Bifidobacterium sp. ESL0769]
MSDTQMDDTMFKRTGKKTGTMLQYGDPNFVTRVKINEKDKFAHKAISNAQDAQWVKRETARAELGNWEGWRDLGEQIRQQCIRYLPDYLEEFSDNVEKRGGHVFFAQTDVEARDFITDLVKKKQAHKIVKPKSMVTSEIGLDKALLKIPDVKVTETDLAEFILELDNWDEPSHLVFPALHKNRDQVLELFRKIGYTGDNDPQHEARFSRKVLRERFLEADMSITGCNFAVADQGMVNIVTNEGNADLSMSIAPTQVVVMGMERIVPTLREAETMDNMLVRSAVGSKLTSYCSFVSPKLPDEADGPEDFYVVIVDNGRSNALGTEFEPILQCIRCASCLNVCPIYRNIGGKGYGSIYPGPIGVVLSPLLQGDYDEFHDLPYACSLCSACTATCPVKIPLHEMILKHREIEMNDKHMGDLIADTVMKVVGIGTGHSSLFHTALTFDHVAMNTIAKKGIKDPATGRRVPDTAKNLDENGKHEEWMPFVFGGWTKVRDLPEPPAHSKNFRTWFNDRKTKQYKAAGNNEEFNKAQRQILAQNPNTPDFGSYDNSVSARKSAKDGLLERAPLSDATVPVALGSIEEAGTGNYGKKAASAAATNPVLKQAVANNPTNPAAPSDAATDGKKD